MTSTWVVGMGRQSLDPNARLIERNLHYYFFALFVILFPSLYSFSGLQNTIRSNHVQSNPLTST